MRHTSTFLLMSAFLICAGVIQADEVIEKTAAPVPGRGVGELLTFDGHFDLDATIQSGYQGSQDMEGLNKAVFVGDLFALSHCPPYFTFTGESSGDRFGGSVSGAGDVNKDGFDDLIVGATFNEAGGQNAGRAYVYDGQSGLLLYTFTGAADEDQFGGSVSGAGDVNNDGYDDLIVGAALNDAGGFSAGRAYVYSGQNGHLLHTVTGKAPRDYLGFSVSGAGDVNNDGFDDLIVGAPQPDVGEGRAYVYSGQNGHLLYSFTGAAMQDMFGYSVSGAGDVDNDGFADLLVGAPDNKTGSGIGWAYVYSGQTGHLLYIFTGEAAGDNFGSSVSGAGDVNNDGYDDLIVGADANDAGGAAAGRAYVYSGQTGLLLYTFTGAAELDRFGTRVSGAGDVNNDGFDDLIVGAFGSDAGGYDAGQAYVYSGQSGLLLYTFTGEAAGDWFGFSVSGAGDVNSDDFDDIIMGAYYNSAGGYIAGRAYVFSVRSCVKIVQLDIKPGSCPNPINGNSAHGQGKAVLPVAIMGSADFDVHDIDLATVALNGTSPVRWNYEDVGAPPDDPDDECACSEAGPDGYTDLKLQFYSAGVVASLGNDNAVRVEGQLYDGTLFEGQDCVTLVGRSASRAITSDLQERGFEVRGNYPNPFNPITRISFYLPDATDVKLEIYNILGQHVSTLIDQSLEAGDHSVAWNGSQAASGIYYYRLQAGDKIFTDKMLLLK